MKENDKWLKNLRNKLEDHSEPLPEDLWGKLEQELSESRVIPMWRTPRFAAAAAAVLIVAVSSLTFWFVDSSVTEYQDESQPVADIPADSDKTDDLSIVSTSEPVAVASVSTQMEADVQDRMKVIKKAVENLVTNPVFPEVQVPDMLADVQEGTEIVQTVDADASEGNETSKDEETNRMRRNLEADRRRIQENTRLLAVAEKDNARKWTVGVSAGNTPYAASRSFDGISRLNARSLYSGVTDMVAVSEKDGHTAYNQVLLNNRDRNSTTDVHHKMPVTVGASVKWNITDRWALETGLSYTMLSSELHSGSGSYLEEDQKLHYLGVPLKVHYNVWSNRWVSLYASAGGMVEQCVSGSTDVVYVNGTSDRKTEHNSLDVDQLQWSVSAAAGVQVNFTKNIGLYAEPGMAYYFDDGSQIETIRKEHPFNFNLQFGLRFTIE